MKLNSLLIAVGRFGSKAGSEESTHSRGIQERGACSHVGWDLNHPPTSVGGIQERGACSRVGWI